MELQNVMGQTLFPQSHLNPVGRIFPPCDSPIKSYVNSRVKTEAKKKNNQKTFSVRTDVILQRKQKKVSLVS